MAGSRTPLPQEMSPGMEGPTAQPYDVVTFDKQGTLKVYSHH